MVDCKFPHAQVRHHHRCWWVWILVLWVRPPGVRSFIHDGSACWNTVYTPWTHQRLCLPVCRQCILVVLWIKRNRLRILYSRRDIVVQWRGRIDAENGLQRNELGCVHYARYGGMLWGIMTHRQKWLLHPLSPACDITRSPQIQTTRGSLIWRGKLPAIQQLLYHGNILPSVNSSAIFDAPISCCGVSYHRCIVPSANI